MEIESKQIGLVSDVLQAMARCFDERVHQPFIVIGATARDIISIIFKSDRPMRRTRDLDISVAVADWKSFNHIAQSLQECGFRKDDTIKQRFYYPIAGLEYEVDVIPFGGVSPDEKHIYWPPDMDPMMTIRGFNAVLSHCIEIAVPDAGYSFQIPTAAGLFLLKLDAWVDRHYKTDKDAQDMRYLMDSYYLPQCTEPKYEAVFDVPEFTVLKAGAYMLAIDICELLTEENLRFYYELVRDEVQKAEASQLLQMTMRSDDYTDVEQAWGQMRDVLQMKLSEYNA